MSLTSFISIHDVKERFSQEFPLPRTSLKGSMVAPPVTKHYTLMGTAFDYLMRFRLERLNQKCVTQPWVAETSVELTGMIPRLTFAEKQAKSLLKFAKESHLAYLKAGDLSENLLKSTVYLAQLDGVYRAGMVDPSMGTVDPGDLEDLRRLVGAVNPDLFTARRHCLLNPTFGNASFLVGGADADIYLDDTLIDIKTTKYLDFNREQYNQLVGYYILTKISGLVGALKNPSVRRIGIYFSRYGVLHTIPTDAMDTKGDLDGFIRWFTERAKEEFPKGSRARNEGNALVRP